MKLLLATALAGFLAMPAGAEVLILKDGMKVVTQGNWEVDGRRVLFFNEHGIKSQVRLSEVDVEKSMTYNAKSKRQQNVEQRSTLNVDFQPDVVALSKEVNAGTVGAVMHTEKAVELGSLARLVGTPFPEGGPDPEAAGRLREMTTRFLYRLLNTTAKYDLEKTYRIPNASPELAKIAQDAGRIAANESDSYVSSGARKIEQAFDKLANMAEQNPGQFAERIAPYQRRYLE